MKHFAEMNAADEKFDAEVGNRVRCIREIRRLSQTALGEVIGVSFQQVQKYERGANRISCSALRKIAGALGCRMAELLGEEPGTYSDVAALQAFSRDILAIFKKHGLKACPTINPAVKTPREKTAAVEANDVQPPRAN